MPRLFSYGSLQEDAVQIKTFGRLLRGRRDELVGYERSSVRIDDTEVAAALGRTHHANVSLTGDEQSRVEGMVFEIRDDELAGVDAYESAFAYVRVSARLAGGGEAWVYVHAG